MFNLSTADNGTFERALPKTGLSVARLISIVDQGTHEKLIGGEKKRKREVRITWELPTQLHVFKEENGAQPFVISNNYTLSLHPKSSLHKLCVSMRGEALPETFDISSLLGQGCMLNVIHKTVEGGKTYANIDSVAPLMEGSECPALIGDQVLFSIEDFSSEVYHNLPEWQQKVIDSSDEMIEAEATRTTSDSFPE